ncbi:NAD-dependent epimerase/dehydratase family protein [Thalassococcus sp. S3]|uniref:NAD-dependent epimerase/dehydratase family protein n=1 Tax=Thalassococcus sp. S3 TaxID=2017482 RepID=UPI00102476DE|nr:NAD-dependent epimerase/dehydratase family protein [Thalassococcus sp. S3]QBF30020.1 dihydrokaempferol 4-reductase [Thalassococcus sp. S3]
MTHQTVLLTGISGFIAKRIARVLLDKGYSVRGSLRSLSRADEVRAAMGDVETDRLSFVELDLGKDEGWAEALDGVDALLHTASPFPLSEPKDEEELIRPAVDGTLRALTAAQAKGVNRIVLTSSMAAVMHVDRPEGHAFGPKDWTDPKHPTANAYIRSKTLAERAAWDFVRDNPEMQLTTINPGLVCGTPADARYGSSLEVIERVWSGRDPVQPNFGLPVVDIADVADLHVAALENPASIGQRVITADSFWMMPEIASTLASAFPNRKIATRKAPNWLLRLLALFDPMVRTVLPSLDRRIAIDNSATRGTFGLTFIPAETAMLDSARFLDSVKG